SAHASGIVSPVSQSTVTQAGTIVGTVQYMAPEQLDGKQGDARSGIFAFGRDRLRDDDRPAGVRGPQSLRPHCSNSDRDAAGDGITRADDATRARACREDVPRERSERTMAGGWGRGASVEMDRRDGRTLEPRTVAAVAPSPRSCVARRNCR